MYSSSTSYNPPLSNNPFIEDPSHPSNRYPDLSQSQSQWSDSTNPQPQYQPDNIYQYPAPISSAYGQQASQFQVSQQRPPIYPPLSHPPTQISLTHPPPQPLSHPPPNYPPPYQQPPPQQGPPPTAPFKPSSSFGQTLQSSMSGGGPYGYLPSGGQPSQTSPAYNPAQLQLNNPSYVAQLDPYGPIPQGWATTDTSTATPQSQSHSHSPNSKNNNNFEYGNNTNRNNQNQNNNSLGFSPSGDPHPRDYIRSHKQEIEDWDSYTWKQLLNSCEALKNSWEWKRNELKTKLAGLQSQHRYAGYYDRTQIQQEGGRIQAVS